MSAAILFAIGVLISFMLSFKELLVFVPQLPEITGFSSEERTYLLIFQNNDELRPTGGFISSYGLLTFKNGFYTGLDLQDVYVDVLEENPMEAPYPLKKLMGLPTLPFNYGFRDGNFYPQFPLAARNLEKMFKITHPDINIDGFIGVNFSVLEDLLGVTGPLTVDGMIMNKMNLFETIEREVNNIDRHNIEDLANRKNILKDLARELEKEIFSRPDIWPQIGQIIMKNLSKKSIQLFFKNGDLQTLVVEKGWGGVWESTDGDFFAINEANYGGLKSNRYMKKNITYRVVITPNPKGGNYSLESYLAIDIYHYGIENVPISGNYSGYLRTYVPIGAKLIKTNGTEDQKQTNEKFYYLFSSLLHLSPGEKLSLSYYYKLPSKLIKDNKYSLYIPKQSGADEDTYTVIVELPQGYSMNTNTFTAKENIGFYTGKMTKDLKLDLEIISDTNPPYVIYQNIDNLNTATIWFNEKIAKESAEKISNFNFIDQDQINREESNDIKIQSVKVEGKKITLTFTGMTFQAEEKFILEMKNIEDIYGNSISPNPKTITLVQRINKPIPPPPEQEISQKEDFETQSEPQQLFNESHTHVESVSAITPENPDYYK